MLIKWNILNLLVDNDILDGYVLLILQSDYKKKKKKQENVNNCLNKSFAEL